MKPTLLLGTVGAIVGALLGGIAWAAVTATTHFQIGYMAIGVGILAGYGMRLLGGGRDRADGIVAGIVAFLGCAVGNLLTAVLEFAPHDTAHRGVVELTSLVLLNPRLAWMMSSDNFGLMDLFFYALAVYAGYRTALKPRGPAATGDSQPAVQHPDVT